MMKTEINLYQAFAAPVVSPFLPWTQFLFFNFFCLGLMILMLLSSIGQYFYASYINNKIHAQYETVDAAYLALKAKFPAEFFTGNLTKTAAELREQLNKHEKIVHSVINIATFSEQLHILSKMIVPNVWLTKINIENSGNNVNLFGKSLSATELQTFVKHIFTDPHYNDYVLNINDIISKEKKDDKNIIHFELNLVKHNQ